MDMDPPREEPQQQNPLDAIMQQLMHMQTSHHQAMTQQEERMERLEAALAKATKENIRKEPEDLEKGPDLSAERSSPPALPIQAEPPRRPRTRFPDPPMYAGGTSEWPTWKAAMVNKLTVDGEAIGSRKEQFLYVFSRLEKMASKNTVTYMEHRRETAGPEDLLNHLATLYGDPNAQARAGRRLQQLKQGEGTSFAKFLPRLEKEFADAGAIEWPDQVKQQILLSSLNTTMKTALFSRGIPNDFLGLINRLHEISTDKDTLGLHETKPYRTARASNTDEMDWTPTVSVNRTETRTTRRRNSAEKQPKRARWVNEEEIQDRRQSGRCFRCGRHGCRVAECPYLPAFRPENQRIAAGSTKKGGRSTIESEKKTERNTRVKKAKPVIESDTSNDEFISASDSESGKE